MSSNQGTRFKEIRQLLGMTQQEVANLLKINQGHVSTYERNKCVNAEARVQLRWFIEQVRKMVQQETRS